MEDTQQPEQGFTWTDDKVKEIIRERDEATAALKSALAVDKVTEAIQRAGLQVKDPYAAAKRIAGQVQPDDDGDYTGAVKAWYEDMTGLLSTATADANATPDPEPIPAPPATPGLTTNSGPSPANPGQTPQPEKLTINSPEIKQAMQANDWGQIRKWTAEERYEPSSEAGQQMAERIRRSTPQG